MSTRPLKDAVAGEHIVQAEPSPQTYVDAGWRSRPNLYTGRALSTRPLIAEQAERSGRLALHGQRVSPGVVSGLEVELESTLPPGSETPDFSFQIAPGMGLTATGEDVSIPRTLTVRTDALPVYWPGDAARLDLSVLAHANPVATQDGLKAAVLVLVPVESLREDLPDPNDPGEVDPEVRALEDTRLLDGCALVLVAWPPEWSMPPQDAQWRNRLAWQLFEAERKREPGQLTPWEEAGVPLALVGFEPPTDLGQPATPLFVDRAAVVRPGGAPRSRTPLLEARGSPLLWQARLDQLSEQLSTFTPDQVADGTALQAFAYLPPVGKLPLGAVGISSFEPRFFPSSFTLETVPVPVEQLDAIAQASASLAPLDTTAWERVRVLVPVPQIHFEPRLLLEEDVAPAFEEAITDATTRLIEWLGRREILRGRGQLLLDALEGAKTGRFPSDPPDSEEQPPDPNLYGSPEEPYGTKGQTVPALEDVLWLNGTWAQPDLLGWDSYEVATASSGEPGTFAIVSRYNLSYYGTYLLVRSYKNRALVSTDFIFYGWSQLDFQPVWSNNELIIAVLARQRYPSDTTTPPHVAFLRKGTHGWVVPKTTVNVGVSSTGLRHFTALSWAPGCIDAFVGTSTGIRKVTWINGSVDTAQVVALPKQQSVNQMVALSPQTGQVELLFLGRSPELSTPYSLHHVSGTHADQAPALQISQTMEVAELLGFQLDACISNESTAPGGLRIDALVMGNDSTVRGIRHGWFTGGSWKRLPELVSPSSGDALSVVSKDGRLHAFWWDSISLYPWIPGPLMYRMFDKSRWQTPEVVTRQALYQTQGLRSLRVVLDGTNPIDVVLASYSGLLHLKKVADSTREKVRQVGLRGLVGNIEGLYQQSVDFVRAGTARVQAEITHVRQLMLTSSTEASRLAVSATQGSTLVDSSLVARAGNDTYLTAFASKLGRAPVIRLSDAMEALEEATTLRRELTEQLVERVRLLLSVKEIGLDVTSLVALRVALVEYDGSIPRVKPVKLSNGTETKEVDREDISVKAMVDTAALRKSVLDRIDTEPENVRRALARSRLRWTESDYFSTALRHLEYTLTLLNNLDRHMRIRVGTLESYRDALRQIEQFVSALDKRLKEVDGEVAETRQDILVARALLAEEQMRVTAVNQRRQQVLAQHVPFLVFQRPRVSDLTEDVMSRLLDTGIVTDVLPEVLASTAAAPPELHSYVELVRDSPLKWFTLAPTLLHGLDRLDFIKRTYVRAQARALQRLPVPLPVFAGRAPTSIALGLSRVLSAREDLVARQRRTFIDFQPVVLETRTWLELQQGAREQLSLGDLADTAHGRSDVGEQAATELEHLSKVAAGLYRRFSEVLPVIRLEWAEQMSQYDAPVDLRDLSHLPRWDEVEVMDRREMQTLVKWLFARVVLAEPDAVSLMNDLVRVCLLLASHAPVNELLSGHVSKPSVAKVGGTIGLAVDPARARVGMQVVIRSGDHTVEAVVEDLSASVVTARVLMTSSATVHLPEQATAHFVDPGRGASARLAALGAQW